MVILHSPNSAINPATADNSKLVALLLLIIWNGSQTGLEKQENKHPKNEKCVHGMNAEPYCLCLSGYL